MESSNNREIAGVGSTPLVVVEPAPRGGFQAFVGGHLHTPVPFLLEDLGVVVSDFVRTMGSNARIEIFPNSVDRGLSLEPEVVVDGVPPAEVGAPMDPAGRLLEFTMDGFLPGEEVTLAPFVARGSADETGRARISITREGLPGAAREAGLIGRMSSHLVVYRLPSCEGGL